MNNATDSISQFFLVQVWLSRCNLQAADNNKFEKSHMPKMPVSNDSQKRHKQPMTPRYPAGQSERLSDSINNTDSKVPGWTV